MVKILSLPGLTGQAYRTSTTCNSLFSSGRTGGGQQIDGAHDGDGALADQRDRHRVGAHAVACDAGGVGGVEANDSVMAIQRPSERSTKRGFLGRPGRERRLNIGCLIVLVLIATWFVVMRIIIETASVRVQGGDPNLGRTRVLA